DLHTLADTPRRPSLVLVCGDLNEGDRGRACLLGCCGPARWQLRISRELIDLQLLPGNQLLVAGEGGVVERNLEGEVVRERLLPKGRYGGRLSVRRRADGDTFVFTGDDWLIVNPEGEMVLPSPLPERDDRPAGWADAKLLGNGRVLVRSKSTPWELLEI